MPKIVDHEERRGAVVDAVSRVIARIGIDSSTIRSIAKEAGVSTGNLAHYFKNKDDILTSALKRSHQRINARWEQKLQGLRGMAALRELVLDNLPLDDEREDETRLEVSYWARALTAEHVLKVQRAEAALLYDRLLALVRQARQRSEITTPESDKRIAERLLALIDGISLHALLYPERLNRPAQRRIIEREFDLLTGADEPPRTVAKKKAR
jgi:AcrR family transcriptional regulator